MRCFSLTTAKPFIYSVCGQLISKDGFLHHRRTFEHHVLIFVMEGTLHITANDVEYHVGAGQYIFLPTGEEHFGTAPSLGKLSYFWVHIVPGTEALEIFPDAASGVESLSDIPSTVGTTTNTVSDALTTPSTIHFPEFGKLSSVQRITRLFRQLLELSMEEQPYFTDMLHYTLSLILMELALNHTKSEQTPQKEIPAVICDLCEWIKQNYYRPFSLSEPAQALGYQTNYLSKLFKTHMGMSLISYTNKIRMEAAKNLLEIYALPTKEVAYSCGFSDEKYFMKVFKASEGCTPTEYKKHCKYSIE